MKKQPAAKKPEKPEFITAEFVEKRLLASEFEKRISDLEKFPIPEPSLPRWLGFVWFVTLGICIFLCAAELHTQAKRLDALSVPVVLNSLPQGKIDLPATGTLTLAAPPLHSMNIEISVDCWIAVTEQTPEAKTLFEGAQRQAGLSFLSSFDEQTAVEVRAGCPGDVHYTVNGQIVHPDNVSKTPDKSEVVDLLI